MRLTKIVSSFCVLFLVFFSWSLHAQDTTLISSGEVWKYYDYDSSPGADWKTAGFNDNSWSSGNAKLGYSDGAVTEIEPGTSASTKYITAYFRKTFNYTDDGNTHTLNLGILRDDGAIVYINGSEVARSNMPSGSVSHNTLASSTVSSSDESTFFPFELSTNTLVNGSNVIAVEIHQRSTTSSDMGFDLTLTVSTGTPVNEVANIRFGSTGNPLNGLTVTWQNTNGADKIKWGYTQSFEQGEFTASSRSDYSDYLYDYTFPTVQADSTIYYSIYNDSAGTWGPNRTFNTASPTSSTQFTFTAGGDSRTNIDDWKSVADVWENSAFVLFLGDIVSTGSNSSQWEDWYSYGNNFIPYNLIYHCKGNHDTGGIYENQFALPGNGLYYAFEYGNAVFICLDSENPGSSTQTSWLESTLTTYQNKTWKFVFFHQPFYTGGSHETDMWSYWDTWWQLFDDYGVNIIFGGHDHNYQRSLPINRNVSTSQAVAEYGSGPDQGRCQIVSGGAGAPLYGASNRWWTAENTSVLNYCIIEINGSSLTLTAKDENLTVIDQVVMNAGAGTTPPTAAFTGSPTSGSAPLTVSFTDQSTGPDSWSWDFGDTGTSTLQNPDHIYTTAGTYTVSLTVTNAYGNDVVTKTDYITVTVPQPPVADFTASSTLIEEGQSIAFTDTSTNTPTSWTWSFPGGNPSSSTAQNPTVTYNTAGIYNVTLTAANAADQDTETRVNYITVTEVLPTVGNITVFSSNTTSANRRAMPFTMPEDGTINSVTMYHTGGSGSMILGVYDGEGSPADRLGVTPTTAVNGSTGWQTINLTGSAFVSGGTTVWLAWVYESNPGIHYESGTPGRVDAGEAWSGGMPDPYGSSTQADYLYSIYATYATGGGPTQYTLTADTTGQGNITLDPTGGTYNEGTVVTLTANPTSGWQFDGWSGDLSGSTNPTTITMDSNKTVTATFTEVVVPDYTLTVNTVGQGNVTLDPAGGTYSEGTVVTLTAGPVSGWQFDGWSGDLSGSTNPTTITMNSNKNVTATFSEISTTQTVGNTTVFSSNTTSANRRAMPFTMPEDGTISSVSMYHTGGSGSMILGVYDGEGSPADRLGVTSTTTVSGSTGWQTINLQSPAFVAGGTTVWLAWVYESNPGIAYESGSPGRVDAGEAWSGGMPAPYGSGSQSNYLYSIYATYTPGGGTVYPPVAGFSGTPTTIDEGQSVSFTDLSTNTPTSWSWTFPGGTPSTSTEKNPVVTYNTAGTYSVTLTVSNSAGSDSETSTDYITVEVPTVTYCTSSGDDQGYEWIAGVQAGSIDNASGATGYSDFTAQSANLTKGASVSITLTPGFDGDSYDEYWKIWIDLNQDGDFDDAGEEVYSGSSSSAISDSFTVPASAVNGNTRMRISMQYDSYPSSCGTFNYGEVEDYTVNIQ